MRIMQIPRIKANNPNNYMRIPIMQMARMIRAIRVSTFACPVALTYRAAIRCNSSYSW